MPTTFQLHQTRQQEGLNFHHRMEVNTSLQRMRHGRYPHTSRLSSHVSGLPDPATAPSPQQHRMPGLLCRTRASSRRFNLEVLTHVEDTVHHRIATRRKDDVESSMGRYANRYMIIMETRTTIGNWATSSNFFDSGYTVNHYKR